jgi:hypothetical protein
MTGSDSSEASPLACPSLFKALERCFKHDKPEILDLGPFCGSTAVHLADRGARVSVAEFEPPPPDPVDAGAKPSDDAPLGPPLRIDQDDGRFHLVLLWEHADFTPPERLPELGAEIHRILAEEGLVLLFALSNLSNLSNLGGSSRRAGDDAMARTMGRYKLEGEDKIVREPVAVQGRRRYTHPTREIERALAPLAVQGIHLQRNQMREFLALKKKKKA